MSPRSVLGRLLLSRYAGGALPRVLAQLLRTALDEDPALAAAYTALRRAERAAAGGAHTSGAQRDVVEAALFASTPRTNARPKAVTREDADCLLTCADQSACSMTCDDSALRCDLACADDVVTCAPGETRSCD